MGLLDKLKDSILGMGGKKPQQFGVNPIPPDSLHQLYSVDGQPNVTWRPSNGSGFKPQPSTLDELDSKAPNLKPNGVVSQVYKSKSGRRYKDLGPTEGRY
jgi:hypothetical protein